MSREHNDSQKVRQFLSRHAAIVEWVGPTTALANTHPNSVIVTVAPTHILLQLVLTFWNVSLHECGLVIPVELQPHASPVIPLHSPVINSLPPLQ